MNKRVREIISVFLKHGLKDGLAIVNNPAQLREAVEELGPTFIKIGQVLSTRPDIVSQPIIEEFKKLRDNVSPVKFEDIKIIIEKELNKPLYEIFTSFDREPIACASIAQVHSAKLKSGQKVVVKVQRPNIKDMIIGDINILKKLAKFLNISPQVAVVNPVEIIDELGKTLKTELDFINEAKNIEIFEKYNSNIKYIKIPKVYNEYTTENLIVMEYIEGIKISEKSLLVEKGYLLDEIAEKLVYNYMKQIFIDGFFHGDPHPANIIITGDAIAYIDFGMMGVLNETARKKYLALLEGIATGDIDKLTNSILRIAIKKRDLNFDRFSSQIKDLYRYYAYLPVEEINIPEITEEIFKICRKNGISMPREATMLIKGIVTIESIISDLAPDINIMQITVPFIRKLKLENIGINDITDDFLDQVNNMYILLSKQGLKVPLQLGQLIGNILDEKVKIKLEHTNLDKGFFNELNKMVNRIVFSIIVASLIIGSSLIIRSDFGQGLKVFGITNVNILGLIGFLGAGVLGFWVLISILRSGKL
ncbi:MAG TPA: AarF/ABC1/UbiB kinase family protein [Clostridiaceae bacterium]|nr:AarF/ABC1/UbiB kinase family protein [Clostridiaceae bacterium]